MRHPVLSLVVLVAAASLLMLPLSAHHEITAKFDPAKTTKLQGIVTLVDWANPQCTLQTSARETTWPTGL
jgi:hypothetical protein